MDDNNNSNRQIINLMEINKKELIDNHAQIIINMEVKLDKQTDLYIELKKSFESNDIKLKTENTILHEQVNNLN